jgi:signal transduction histidine kinase
MIFFGTLSCILGFVQFDVPGVQGATSDLREIPLLISIFHASNPWTAIGTSLISSISTSPQGSYLSTFLMHSISLIFTWYVYDYLKKLNKLSIPSGIIWLVYVMIYYLIFLEPICVLSNHMVGINTDKKFIPFYIELISSMQFEIITSALVSSLYLIQHKMRIALIQQKAELEVTVKDRTEELVSTIEELKTTQQHLIQSEKMASLGTLTAGVAHEINNPLNFISGGLTLIGDMKNEEDFHSEEMNEKFRVGKEMVKTGLERATNIVKSLMTFSQPGSAILIDSDIHQIIDNTLLFLNHKLKSIKIVKEYELQENLMLYPDKIHQVIMHLIENAIYAINLDLTNAQTIFISTKAIGDYAVLKISNTGPKILKKYLNQIFDPFFTTKDPGQGTGIGLSICYTLISEHRGNIYAENDFDTVSFIIELPLNK